MKDFITIFIPSTLIFMKDFVTIFIPDTLTNHADEMMSEGVVNVINQLHFEITTK